MNYLVRIENNSCLIGEKSKFICDHNVLTQGDNIFVCLCGRYVPGSFVAKSDDVSILRLLATSLNLKETSFNESESEDTPGEDLAEKSHEDERPEPSKKGKDKSQSKKRGLDLEKEGSDSASNVTENYSVNTPKSRKTSHKQKSSKKGLNKNQETSKSKKSDKSNAQKDKSDDSNALKDKSDDSNAQIDESRENDETVEDSDHGSVSSCQNNSSKENKSKSSKSKKASRKTNKKTRYEESSSDDFSETSSEEEDEEGQEQMYEQMYKATDPNVTPLEKGKEVYVLKKVKKSVRANAYSFVTCTNGLIPGIYKEDAIRRGTWCGRVGNNLDETEKEKRKEEILTLHPKGRRAILRYARDRAIRKHWKIPVKEIRKSNLRTGLSLLKKRIKDGKSII